MNSDLNQSQEIAALDELNRISEELIRESYLAQDCRSIWGSCVPIVGKC